mmetsp:Transcript_32449/g.127269  ORF Transcript_32449/g.127269 Transcript_32449/m.127269 type:complete len:134 (+) Transcript_32449:2070-2471(+)
MIRWYIPEDIRARVISTLCAKVSPKQENSRREYGKDKQKLQSIIHVPVKPIGSGPSLNKHPTDTIRMPPSSPQSLYSHGFRSSRRIVTSTSAFSKRKSSNSEIELPLQNHEPIYRKPTISKNQIGTQEGSDRM